MADWRTDDLPKPAPGTVAPAPEERDDDWRPDLPKPTQVMEGQPEPKKSDWRKDLPKPDGLDKQRHRLVAESSTPESEAALAKAAEADTAPVAILIAMIRHMTQVHLVVGQMERGGDRDALLRSLRPPLHFKRQGAMKRQCTLWNRPRAERALSLLAEADRQCKSSGLPDRAICAQALMRVAQGARAGARR